MSQPTPSESGATSRSLFLHSEGEVCPQFPLFRHPLYRKLGPICYIGMPGGFLVSLCFAGGWAALFALGLFLGFMLLVIASLVITQQHARAAALHQAAMRLGHGWRFVCPGCFHAGPVRHACGACKEELEPFVLLTRGWYLNDCARCHARVFGSFWARGTRPSAYCRDCGYVTDVRHHRRRVRMMAALDPCDLESLAAAVEGTLEQGSDGRFFFRDTGATMRYVLDLGSEEGGCLPPRHAARQIEAVWLDTILDDPLRLGEALDRLIRKADLAARRRREVVLHTPRAALPPAVRNIVEGRFPRVECGVSAGAFFFGEEVSASRLEPGIQPERIPATGERESVRLTIHAG